MRRSLLVLILLCPMLCFGQAWSGIIATPRATDWTQAGLPGDIPPDIANSWTQSGTTVPGCGSSGSFVSPSACGITAALAACGTNHYVLFAGNSGTPADFYLNATVNIPSNCVARGGGAAYTQWHFSTASGGCNGQQAVVCFGGATIYGGQCAYFPNSTTGSQGPSCPFGVVSVTHNGTTVTRVSGPYFPQSWVGASMNIAGTSGTISTVASNGGSLVLTAGYGGSTSSSAIYRFWQTGFSQEANWTAGYSQNATSITLDNVTGINLASAANPTLIYLDQCNTAFSGNTTNADCAPSAGAITSASVGSGGSAYAVNDTFAIACVYLNGDCYGAIPNATATVTSVSGGAVTGFTINSGGGGYTLNNTIGPSSAQTTGTIALTGSGSGLTVVITAVTAYDNNGLFICDIQVQCSALASSNIGRSERAQTEINMATAISGTGPYTVTLIRPIVNPNWASGQSPKAWWGTGTTLNNAGIEDIGIDEHAVSGGASAVGSQNAANIWAYGIGSNTANTLHVNTNGVFRMLIRDSYFYGTTNHGSGSYGLGAGGQVGDILIENNIIQGVVSPLTNAGPCNSCVNAYNFSVNDWFGASGDNILFAMIDAHSAATNYILSEGNIGAGIDWDVSHGPHFFNTAYRNALDGFEANNGVQTNNSTIPLIINAYSRYNNFLANVLGVASYHTVAYKCSATSGTLQFCSSDQGTSPGYKHIVDCGFGSDAQRDYTNSPALLNDPLTCTSSYFYGEYDAFNGATQYNSAEVPTGDPNYPNSVPSGGSATVWPVSFYNGATAHSNCGTGLPFWKNPTTGLCPPYPSVGPDVTSGDIGMCTSGTYINSRALTSGQCSGGTFSASINAGHENSNPAMRCYLNQMNGPPDGTGSFLSFNRASCYEADPSSTYTITVSSITGNGTVTSSDSVINCTTGTTGTCSDSTATGTVTLTESPSSGYSFGGWGGGTCTGTSSTCAVTSAATVTATFNLIPTVDATIKGVTVTQGVTITH